MTKSITRRILIVTWTIVVLAAAAVRPACAGQAPGDSQKTKVQITQDDVNTEFFSVINAIKRDKPKNDQKALERDISGNLVPYVSLFTADLLPSFLSQVQEWRTDVQVESPTSSAGTTSLVSKGSVPSLLGLAVEDGALTQTTSGTSVTFRTNPTGLIKAIAKQGYVDSGPDTDQDAVVKFLRRSSASVTFNTSGAGGASSSAGQGSQAGTFTGSAQQISGFEFRYDIINHRDPRDARYKKKWAALRDGALAQVAATLNGFAEPIMGIPQEKKWIAAKTDADAKKKAYDTAQVEERKAITAWEEADHATRPPEPTLPNHQAMLDAQATWQAAVSAAQTAEDQFKSQYAKWTSWQERSVKTINDAAADSVESAVLSVAKDFMNTFGDDPAVKAAAKTAADAISKYLKDSGGIRNMIDKSPIITFDYTDTRQATMATAVSMASANASPATPGLKPPDLSTFKLIIAGGTVGGATLTGNASMTLFNSNPQGPATGRVRDFQLSGQFDVPLREIQNIGVPTLTFAGLFLSLRQQPLGQPVQVNGVDVNLKGNMGFAQAKISFPIKKGSGVTVPLSFTYASRTEFNKEHDVRGSIGVTFNLDTVFANMKP